MAGEPVITVCIADHDWTLDALHCACRMARRSPAVIILVSMIPVQHTAWLGTDWGYMNFGERERGALADYCETVLDYGLEYRTVCYQYTDFVTAVADAADELDARVVFANLPAAPIPAWRRFQLWWLSRWLAKQRRQFIMQPDRLSVPALVPEAQKHEVSPV